MTPRRIQSFHINLLKKWIGPPPQDAHFVLPTAGDPSTLEKLVINKGLKDELTQELMETIQRYSPIFSDIPGHTCLVEHQINTTPGKHIRLRPYRIPEARRQDVKREVKEMLKLGVIRPS